MRKVLAVLAAFALCAIGSSPVHAWDKQTFLMSYSNGDSTTQRSPWFDIKNATKLIFRCYTTRAAFAAAADPDSLFSDSLSAFGVLISDSVCCVVSSRASAADSFSVAATADTANGRMVAVFSLPVNKKLRIGATPGGIATLVVPIAPFTNATADLNPAAVIAGKMCRVEYTPVRRNTVTGGQSTQGHRVNGLKNFVVYMDVIRTSR